MSLHPAIIKMLVQKTGCDVSTLQGANFLMYDIAAKTGENISINTIKRLVGLIDYNKSHREYILHIIASYLGFSSYEMLLQTVEDKISNFNIPENFIDLTILPPGAKLELRWSPDRIINIRHLANGIYEVDRSVNSKLKEKDQLQMTYIANSFPLYIKNVVRDGESLGNYSAAMEKGLTEIKTID